MNTPPSNEIHTVCWQGDTDGYLEILDQTALPTVVKHVACKDVPSVIESIKMLRVRGAPAIGIAGAYGMVLAIDHAKIWRKMYSTEEQLARDALSFMKTNVDKRWK
ncbi:hypothetical protein N9B10_07225 [Pirellulales bacterium]|nr:hypothetical protein [Pirellulales bacterium]